MNTRIHTHRYKKGLYIREEKMIFYDHDAFKAFLWSIKEISEIPSASVSKRDLVQNLSYETVTTHRHVFQFVLKSTIIDWLMVETT